MSSLLSLVAALSVLAIASSASAETVIRPAPGQGGSITLGEVAGSGYYTLEPNGFHIVITLTKDESQPVRFEAVLTQGQSITLSAPEKLAPNRTRLKSDAKGTYSLLPKRPEHTLKDI